MIKKFILILLVLIGIFHSKSIGDQGEKSFDDMIIRDSMSTEDSIRMMDFFAYINLSPLANDTILGCYVDSSKDSQLDSIVLAKSDSMFRCKYKRSMWGNRTVSNKYLFTEMPCLNFYEIDAEEPPHLPERYGYQFVLFNICDSSIYHYGGSDKEFSNLVKDYLSNHFNHEDILELVNFYLYTFHGDQGVYILNSVEDYEKIFNYGNEFIYDPNPYEHIDPYEVYLNTVKIIKENIKPIKYVKNNNEYNIEFYTWWPHPEGGMIRFSLDFWKFKVSRSKIELIERKVISNEVDPYMR